MSSTQAPVAYFAVFQHGLGGVSWAQDSVKAKIKTIIREHHERISSNTADPLCPPVAGIELWSTHVNQFFKSHPGVVAIVDRMMPLLRPELVKFVLRFPLMDSEAEIAASHVAQEAAAHERKCSDQKDAADRGTAAADAAAMPFTVTPVRRRLFSCLGHSFGGVILREVITRIHADPELTGAFEFDTYVSVASPHCGVQTSNYVTRYGGKALAVLFSQSVEELLLDNDVMRKRLLSPDHLAAFKRFRHRVLFGCLNGDRRVQFPTACLVYDDATEKLLNKAAKEAYHSTHALKPLVLKTGTPTTTPTTSPSSAAQPTEAGRKISAFDTAAASAPNTTQQRGGEAAAAAAVKPTVEGAAVSPAALAPSTTSTSAAAAATAIAGDGPRRKADPKGAAIADTLRSHMDFTAVPVKSLSWMPTAHNAVMGSAWFSRNMDDCVAMQAAYLTEALVGSATVALPAVTATAGDGAPRSVTEEDEACCVPEAA